MKQKLISLLGALCILCSAFTAYAADEYGVLSEKEKKQFSKQAERDAKKNAKENKKQGWVLNGSGSMEFVIQNHLLKLENYGGSCEEKTGNAENCKTISLGKTRAFMDAVNSYAREERTALRAEIIGEQGDIDNDQVDNLLNSYEAKVADEIKGCLKPSYILTRKLSNGNSDVAIFYCIDTKNSARAKKKALEDALDRSELRSKWKEDIKKRISSSDD